MQERRHLTDLTYSIHINVAQTGRTQFNKPSLEEQIRIKFF